MFSNPLANDEELGRSHGRLCHKPHTQAKLGREPVVTLRLFLPSAGRAPICAINMSVKHFRVVGVVSVRSYRAGGFMGAFGKAFLHSNHFLRIPMRSERRSEISREVAGPRQVCCVHGAVMDRAARMDW